LSLENNITPRPREHGKPRNRRFRVGDHEGRYPAHLGLERRLALEGSAELAGFQ
jgi:hypothetical protein